MNSSGNGTVDGLRDLAGVRDFTTSPAVTSLLDLPWVPLYIGILFFIHPLIGTLVFIGAAILFAIAITNEVTTRPMIINDEGSSRATIAVASSYVRNADVIAAMGMREQLTKRWEQQQEDSLSMKYKVDQKRAKTNSLVKLIRFLLQIGVIGVAAILILEGELTSGATIATILLMRNAISPLEGSINAWRSVLKARNAYQKINRSLYHSPALNKKRGVRLSRGPLRIDGVQYRYFRNKYPLFHGVNFMVYPGEAIALVGPSAAGKSTLSKLLIGIYRPTSGSIRLNGQELTACDPEILGRHIGYLPQSVELFAGTVRENIARMHAGDFEQVVKAAKLVGIHDAITRFSEGYDTQIGEDGAYLSGGQRQRLGLARAVYGNPWLVVLDEPDAHLDTAGKVALVMTIKKLKTTGAIIIVISHHENIHKFVDRIFDLGRKCYLTRRPPPPKNDQRNVDQKVDQKNAVNLTPTARTGT